MAVCHKCPKALLLSTPHLKENISKDIVAARLCRDEIPFEGESIAQVFSKNEKLAIGRSMEFRADQRTMSLFFEQDSGQSVPKVWYLSGDELKSVWCENSKDRLFRILKEKNPLLLDKIIKSNPKTEIVFRRKTRDYVLLGNLHANPKYRQLTDADS